MVRSYERHGPTAAFGLISSSSAPSHYVLPSKHAFVPALEDVLVWDVKRGIQLSMWHETGLRAEVTALAPSPVEGSGRWAVGYADGSVRVWEWDDEEREGSVVVTFNGHKRAVSALAWDRDGVRLASGGKDTELIVWDVVGETGICRLRGHRDVITSLHFLSPPASASASAAAAASTSTTASAGHLLTSAKDTFLKLWDLSTQHCIETVVAHRSEIWAIDVSPDGDLAVTGSGDGEVRVWKIDAEGLAEGLKTDEEGKIKKLIHPLSVLPSPSHTRHKIFQILFHPTFPLLAIQSTDKAVEVLRIRTEEEVRKKLARRRRRAKEKGKGKGKGKGKKGEEDEDEEDAAVEDGEGAGEEVKIEDRITPHLVVRGSGKVRSFSMPAQATGSDPKSAVQILLALHSNALEVHAVPQPTKKSADPSPPESSKIHSLDLPGHRTDIRALALSSDDVLLASASNGSLKIWNMKTTSCLRTLECGYAICATFLPGNRHVLVGTKSGALQLFDLASASLVYETAAHDGPVYGMHVRPDGQALVTGSGDKDVKFWEFETVEVGDDVKTKQLGLVHVRTLKMTDDVLAVKYSPDGRLLAVSLMDATVKVFFQDSLKFFLSLYGHKLPVLSLDISHDSKLIITCSADKNVKIWGLDFGDCHKSIFAHDESIMQVAFERGSHYFWTVSKDKRVGYWDGDKFENIQKLDGHHGEVWALVTSNDGKFVVTGSHDKSIRVWEKTDEPLFLEEEREKELEHLYESDLAATLERAEGHDTGAPEASGVTKQTSQTLMAGERIIEALDLADADRSAARDYAVLSEQDKAKVGGPPPRNPIFGAYNDISAEAYVLRVVEKIPGPELHDALLVLPFGQVVSLMEYLDYWAHKEWNIPLLSRILFFLLKTHHHQIVANRVMRTTMVSLRGHLREALRRQKDIIGFNLAALRFIRRQHEADRTAEYWEEEGMDEEKVRQRIEEASKKRKRVAI